MRGRAPQRVTCHHAANVNLIDGIRGAVEVVVGACEVPFLAEVMVDSGHAEVVVARDSQRGLVALNVELVAKVGIVGNRFKLGPHLADYWVDSDTARIA